MPVFDPSLIRHRPILSARLTLVPERSGIGLAPDPAIFYTSYQILATLADELHCAPLPLLSAAHALHRLTVFFDAENSAALPKLLSLFEALLLQIPPLCRDISQSSSFSFRYTAALDLQDAPYCRSDTQEIIWLSPVEERLDKISANYPAAAPPLLITHALYENLPPDIQQAYGTYWYIMHICCCGRSVPTAE